MKLNLSQTFANNTGDLVEIQKSNFYHFLLFGLGKELSSVIINPFFLTYFEKNTLDQKTKENILTNLFNINSKKKNIKDTNENFDFFNELQNFENLQNLKAEIYLHPSKLKIKGPTQSLHSCFEKGETYATNIYIQGEIIHNLSKTPKNFTKDSNIQKKNKKGLLSFKLSNQLKAFHNSILRIKKYFFLATIPFLTEDGSFFVNGCERVVVNQIIRSPGIYFQKEYLSFQKISYTATFISNNWVWTKFYLDNTIETSAKINQTIDLYKENLEELQKKLKEIPIKYDIFLNINDSNFLSKILTNTNISNEFLLTDLILNLGFTFEEIFDNLKYPNKLSFSEIAKSAFFLNTLSPEKNQYETINTEDAAEITEPENPAIILEDFVNYLFEENQEKRYFSLGESGRYRLNKRLGLNLPLSANYLTGLDFLKIIDCLITFKEENLAADDIDNLKNKQIRSVGDLIQNQFRLALFRYRKSQEESDDFLVTLNPQNLIEIFKENSVTKRNTKFFLNAYFISEILQKSIDRNLREFFLTSQLSQYFDETNPLAELAHKRRISVFGPEGLQREKVNTKVRDIHPSQYGKICPIETPEGENAGLIMSLASFARVNYQGLIESPYFIIENGKILKQTKIFYLNSNQEEHFKLVFANNVLNEKGVILNAMTVVKDGLYFSQIEPQFLNFSALSQFQILSIGTILIPFVEHNDGNRALMGSNMQRQALPLLYAQSPLVGTGFESNVALESGLTIKSECEGLIEFISSTRIDVRDVQDQKISYKLAKFRKSNQKTCNTQLSFYWPGEKIYAGQILADSSSTKNGELALGTNLFIGYLPWEGYNYEDAIVINEKLIKENILTSLHISTFETLFKPTQIVLKKINYLFKFTRKIRTLKKNFYQLKIFLQNSKNTKKNIEIFQKISNEIRQVRMLINGHFTTTKSHSEFLINKEKSGLSINKVYSNSKQNLSSNGIIKIGAQVNGGDLLVSKIQAIEEFKSNSNYQRLWEELRQINDSSFKETKRYKKTNKQLKLLENRIKQTKLEKLIKIFKNINSTYFKLSILLKRIDLLKTNLDKFLEHTTKQISSNKESTYIKSLKIKYKNQKNHLKFLVKEVSLEKIRKRKLGFYMLKLFKFYLQNLYKKTYQNFFIQQLQKRCNHFLNSKIFFSENTHIKKAIFLLTKIYQNNAKIKDKLKFHDFNSLFLKKSQISIFQNIPANLLLKKSEQVFLFQLGMLSQIAKEKNISSENNQFELSKNIRYKDTSFLMPLGSEGKVIDLKISASPTQHSSFLSTSFVIKIFVLESSKIQIGDKLSGRHGNKGVISRILPSKDMPVLPDGTNIDILINPLGVPSRMNVGQLLECTLGLSSFYLGTKIKIKPFDENFGKEASRIFVMQKLKHAALASRNKWLYNEEHPGKFYLRDGRTGEFFDNPVTVGVAYILKLIHLVEKKIHSRAVGSYNKVIEQPLQGKASKGGQRFGEMEVWALEAYGCANTLQELLTVKADDIDGRNDLYKSISNGDFFNKPNPNFSETFICLIRELNALGIDFQFFKASSVNDILKNSEKNVKTEVELFNLLERRLKLRFKSNELKLRYMNLNLQNQASEFSDKTQFQNQTKYLFDSLESFSYK